VDEADVPGAVAGVAEVEFLAGVHGAAAAGAVGEGLGAGLAGAGGEVSEELVAELLMLRAVAAGGCRTGRVTAASALARHGRYVASVTSKMTCPLATDVLLGQVDDALGRLAGGLVVEAFDVVSVSVPDMRAGTIIPVADVVIVARGLDLEGDGRFITAWSGLAGWWCTQEQVDDVVRRAVGQITGERSRREQAAKQRAAAARAVRNGSETA